MIFQAEDKAQGVQVFYKDETIWATQKAISTLFDVNVPAISKHLQNIYESGELLEAATVSKMEIVQQEGVRNIKRSVDFYSLDAIIAVGYRVIQDRLFESDFDRFELPTLPLDKQE